MTPDGKTVAFAASSPSSLGEVYVTAIAPFAPRRLTAMTDQVAGWTLGKREVISWTSKDGTTIEGVLIKPANFDPAKKYPLLCIIHGGPTGIDRPTMIDTRPYPVRHLGGPRRADPEGELPRGAPATARSSGS